MSSPTIAQEWGGFCKMVFGDKKPSESQYTAMRAAFYSGAMIMFKNMVSAPDHGEDAACKAMDVWSEEITNHVAESLQSLSPQELIDALGRVAGELRKGNKP